MKKPRNVKVRIKNLNLRQVFWLTYGKNLPEVYKRFKNLIRQHGYHLSSHHNSTRNSRVYIFYPDAVIKAQMLEARKLRKKKKTQRLPKSWPPRGQPGWRMPEHQVHLEITMLQYPPEVNIVTEKKKIRQE